MPGYGSKATTMTNKENFTSGCCTMCDQNNMKVNLIGTVAIITLIIVVYNSMKKNN